MKSNLFSFKSICAMALIPVGLGVSLSTYAETFNGSLGGAASSTDVYAVICPLTTATIRARVRDNGGVDGVRLTVQVINPQGDARTATAVDGGLSALVSLGGGGPGNYLVTISRSQVGGLENYQVGMDCYTAGGASIAGTEAVLVQNQ